MPNLALIETKRITAWNSRGVVLNFLHLGSLTAIPFSFCTLRLSVDTSAYSCLPCIFFSSLHLLFFPASSFLPCIFFSSLHLLFYPASSFLPCIFFSPISSSFLPCLFFTPLPLLYPPASSFFRCPFFTPLPVLFSPASSFLPCIFFSPRLTYSLRFSRPVSVLLPALSSYQTSLYLQRGRDVCQWPACKRV